MKTAFGLPRAADDAITARIVEVLDGLNGEYFAGVLPSIPVLLSGRLTRTLAYLWSHDDRCTCGRARRENTPEYFVFSRSWVTGASPDDLRELCKHELIHLFQSVKGLPCDHGEEFQRTGKAIGLKRRFCGP